jgi:hypothetical protein
VHRGEDVDLLDGRLAREWVVLVGHEGGRDLPF